jgi:hypothetical protein
VEVEVADGEGEKVGVGEKVGLVAAGVDVTGLAGEAQAAARIRTISAASKINIFLIFAFLLRPQTLLLMLNHWFG